MTHVVAIHQPNFFPWLGYFDKIARSDSFVFLDDVQIQKTGGGWSNRVKMLISGMPKWVTAPIDRNYHGGRKINETRFLGQSPWRENSLRIIQSNYKNAPHYSAAIELIEPLLMNSEDNLAAYNADAILAIANELGISTTKCKWSSAVKHVGQSNERLVSIVRSLGGDTYMCGGGAVEYQDKGIFDMAAVTLTHQDYVPPIYAQHGSPSFLPGLSIVDVLMNLGIDGTRRLFETHLTLQRSAT